MSRKQLQARYDQDTAEQLEQFAEDKGISRSEALRRAARDKLRAEGYREVALPDKEADGDEERFTITYGTMSEDEIDDIDNPKARISPTVRLAGGAVIGLAVIAVFLKQFGFI